MRKVAEVKSVGYCADWREPKDAPADEVVIAWGNGGLRFMYRDDLGQWRNMLRAPRPEPKAWCFPPEPPTIKAA